MEPQAMPAVRPPNDWNTPRSYLLFLLKKKLIWEFHTLYFDYIHSFSNFSQIHAPPPIPYPLNFVYTYTHTHTYGVEFALPICAVLSMQPFLGMVGSQPT